MDRRLTVVGTGRMGAGIAQVAAGAGWVVEVRGRSRESTDRAIVRIIRDLDHAVAKGRLTGQDRDAALANLTRTVGLSVIDTPVVVEAVSESVEVKRGVFARLDAVCPADTVLATNTSAIPVEQIAEATGRPEAVLGTHFFAPVAQMRLCELIRSDQTSDATLQRAREFAEDLGKTCIVVNPGSAGFVTTRLLTVLINEAADIVQSGVASAEDVDLACRLGFGHALGPLGTADLIGLDVVVAAARTLHDATDDPGFAAPAILLDLAAAGNLGRKSGQGFHLYPAQA